MGSWSQLAERQTDEMLSSLVVTLGLFLTAHCQVKLPDQSNTDTNTRLFSGNQALDSGTLGFGLGVGAAVLGSSLLNNNNNNPCGKRRRRSPQNSKDTRFSSVATTTVTIPRTIMAPLQTTTIHLITMAPPRTHITPQIIMAPPQTHTTPQIIMAPPRTPTTPPTTM